MRSSLLISFLLLPFSTFALPISTSPDIINSYQRRGFVPDPVAAAPEALVNAADKKTAPLPPSPKVEHEAPISAKPDTGSPGPFPDEFSKPPPEITPGMIQRLKDAWTQSRGFFQTVIADLKGAFARGRAGFPIAVQKFLDKLSDANSAIWIKKNEEIVAKGTKFQIAQDADLAKFLAAQEAKKAKFQAASGKKVAVTDGDYGSFQNWIDKKAQKYGTAPKVPSTDRPGTPPTS